MHLRFHIFDSSLSAGVPFPNRHFILVALLIFMLCSAGLRGDRKGEAEEAKGRQRDGAAFEAMQAATKTMLMQAKQMEEASTQDPSRKQQLREEIERLQREITQHRQQEKTFKEHAKKAKYAADKVDSSKEKKEGKELKSSQPNRETGNAKISTIEGATFSEESEEPAESVQAPPLEGELADFSTVDQQGVEISVPAWPNRNLVAGEGSTQSIGFDESVSDAFFGSGGSSSSQGASGSTSASATGSDSGIFKAVRAARNPSAQGSEGSAVGGASGSVRSAQVQVPSSVGGDSREGSTPTEPISGALFSTDVLEGMRALLHDQLKDESEQKEGGGSQEENTKASASSSVSTSSKVKGFAVKDLLKVRQAFVLGSTRKVRHRIGGRVLAAHKP